MVKNRKGERCRTHVSVSARLPLATAGRAATSAASEGEGELAGTTALALHRVESQLLALCSAEGTQKRSDADIAVTTGDGTYPMATHSEGRAAAGTETEGRTPTDAAATIGMLIPATRRGAQETVGSQAVTAASAM